MSPWEAEAEFRDAQIDEDLGDSISYIVNGAPLERAPGDPTIPGYIQAIAPDGGFEGQSPLRRRWTCKINRRWLPEGVQLSHRVESPKLDGRYRPAADTIDNDGDYLLFDLQRAP